MPILEWSWVKYDITNGKVVSFTTDSGAAEVTVKSPFYIDLTRTPGTDGFLYKFRAKNSGEGALNIDFKRYVNAAFYSDDSIAKDRGAILAGLTDNLEESFCRCVPKDGGLDFSRDDVRLLVEAVP